MWVVSLKAYRRNYFAYLWVAVKIVTTDTSIL